jgi:radical SAM protein with 4Fe4S-binding SPASM domain
MHIPEIGYDELGKRLFDRIVHQRIPFSGSIELTARCNLQCAHCYINLPQKCRRAQKEEMTTFELFSIVDQLVDAGCMQLLLTGGEPMIRPDFLEVYNYIREKGILVTLFTNGTLITAALADYLSDHPPVQIEITLYGSTQQIFERVTGIAGSYARCMRGIELLLEHDLPLKLKSIIMTLNQHELRQMKAFADRCKVDFRFEAEINKRLDGSRQIEKLRLSPEEVLQLDLEHSRLTAVERLYELPLAGKEDLYLCGAGRSTFHIDARARLMPCLISRNPSYDLRCGSFYEGWNVFMADVVAQKRTRNVPCQTCVLFALCGQCPGWAQLENGDQEEPVEYLCKIAHLRAEALDTLNADSEKEKSRVRKRIVNEGQKQSEKWMQKTL